MYMYPVLMQIFIFKLCICKYIHARRTNIYALFSHCLSCTYNTFHKQGEQVHVLEWHRSVLLKFLVKFTYILLQGFLSKKLVLFSYHIYNCSSNGQSCLWITRGQWYVSIIIVVKSYMHRFLTIVLFIIFLKCRKEQW